MAPNQWNSLDLIKMNLSAYILAAGKGKRLLPFTSHIPKPMLPIINKPIIYHSIERLLLAGFKRIGIVIKKNDTIIPHYIQNIFPKLDPVFLAQEESLGTANAVLQIKKHLESDDFLVIAGDSLFSASYLKKLAKSHIKEKNVITLSLERMDFSLMQYSSTVDFRNGQIWQIREKPKTPDEILSDLNSSALYIFKRSIFRFLDDIRKSERNEYELATAINKVIDEGNRVGGVVTTRVCHISNSHDLWKFNLEFLRETQKKDSNGNLIGHNLHVSRTSSIRNSVIGDNVVINDDLKIEDSVILPQTHVKQSLKNVLIQGNHFEVFEEHY